MKNVIEGKDLGLYILDIEHILGIMEPLCQKYKHYTRSPDLLYVRGIRFPLENRSIAREVEGAKLSSRPFHPVLAAGLMREVIPHLIVSSELKHLFIKNTLNKNCEEVINTKCDIDTVVKEYLDYPLEREDEIELLRLVDDACAKVDALSIPKDFIVDVDIESRYIIIKLKKHICHFRMEEVGRL